MKVVCPSCDKENNLNLEAKVKCGSCGESLSGATYKKQIVSGGVILAIGIVGGQFAEYTHGILIIDNE